ncbi:MAG: FAD binding domain-containing protein [Fidelibacterota bacterium]
MWTSITKIITPKSFKEAIQANSNSSSKLLSGGTYLTSEKNSAVQELIYILPLLNDQIVLTDNSLFIGSGTSLQTIIDSNLNNVLGGWLSKVIKWSCSSKNIRNQRTIGGEIARNRADSELIVLLYALNPILHISNPENKEIQLDLWDGIGIITGIYFNLNMKQNFRLKRFSFLESAPAHLIVGQNQSNAGTQIIIGGSSERIISESFKGSALDQEFIHKIMKKTVENFEDDHNGSMEYKQYLIKNVLTQFGHDL